MSKSQEEYVVDNIEELDVANIEQWKTDSMIQEVKDNNEEIDKFKSILDERINELQAQFNFKKDTLTKRSYFLLSTLKEYAKTQKLRKAKTQSKYTSLAGDIIIKHGSKNVAKPKKEVIDKIEELYPEYVETVEDKKVNWKDLKKKFIIQEDRIFDQETGEDVTSLLDIEEKEEEVIVK